MSRPYTTDQSASLAELRTILKPGDTVAGLQRHRSRSGKSRSISLVVPVAGELLDLDEHAARILGQSLDRAHGGIRTEDCGRDLVYNLSCALFPSEGGGALRFRRL